MRALGTLICCIAAMCQLNSGVASAAVPASTTAPASSVSAPAGAAGGENDELSSLEVRLFDFSYKKESHESRLERLENFVFGMLQKGTDKERLAHLEDSVTPAPKQKSAKSTTESPSNTSSSTDASAPQVAKPAFNDTDYPRVDQLEQQMLGHPFRNEDLPTRLARLETKAFGAPSKSDDLASRVDALDSYAQRNDIFGDRNMLAQAPQYAPTTQAPPPNPFLGNNVTSMQDKVSAMEKAVFGHEYDNRPLKDRVERLEKKVIPYKHDQENLDMTARVNQLWSILRVANTLNSAPVAANPGNANFSQNGYENSNQIGANTSSSQAVSDKPKSSHPWLHKVGRILETAAVAAASSGGMYGPMMGGYGYGGYPGYGYGYGGLGSFGMP